MNDDVNRGAVVGFVSFLLWGLFTIYWKQLHRFDPFELIGYRIACSAALLVVFLGYRRRLRPLLRALRRPSIRWRIVLAAVLLTANWTAYVWAVTHDNVVETSLGYFLAPLGTMLIGVFVLHERMHLAQRIAVAFTIVAVAVLTAGYGRVPVLALIIAVAWSCYGLCKRQVALGPIESLAAETLVLTVFAAALIGWGAGRADGIPALATPWQLVLVGLAGAVTATPLVMFGYAARRVPFTVLAPMQYVVPTINFLLGWLAYHEELNATTVVGFSMVWAALALTTADTVRRGRRTRRARGRVGSPDAEPLVA